MFPPQANEFSLTSEALTDEYVIYRDGKPYLLQVADIFVNRMVPMGRLTLNSLLPILNVDTTAATSVFYVNATGNQVPINNGSKFLPYTFGTLTLALDSNSGHTQYHASGSIFDVFLYLTSSGTVGMGTGPPWSSTSSRGSGAGTTQVGRINALFVNSVDVQLRIGTGATDLITVPAFEAMYVGSFYCTANGQTGMQFSPAAASGGNNTVLAVYNHYNKEPIFTRSSDSTASWNYTSATWRSSNASDSNRINWLDGIGWTPFYATFTQNVAGTTLSQVGIGIDSNTIQQQATAGSVNGGSCCVAQAATYKVGWHFAQAMESGGTNGVYTGTGSQLTAQFRS